MCKLRELDKRFPVEFRGWLDNLTRPNLWRKTGYPIGRDELSFDEWQALAVITRYYEVTDLEAQVPAPQAS